LREHHLELARQPLDVLPAQLLRQDLGLELRHDAHELLRKQRLDFGLELHGFREPVLHRLQPPLLL